MPPLEPGVVLVSRDRDDGFADVIGSSVTCIGSERRRDSVLCQARELVLECEDADLSSLRIRLRFDLDIPPPDLAGVPSVQVYQDLEPRSVSVSLRVQAPLPGHRPQSFLQPQTHRNRARAHRDLGWTIKNDVEFFVFLVGALRSSICAGTSMSKATTGIWIAMLVNILRADRAPDIFNLLLLVSMVVTTQPPQLVAINSIFKSSTSDFARVDNAQNTFVVQAVVGGQEQDALFSGLAAQNLRHATQAIRSQKSFDRPGSPGSSSESPSPCRRRENGAGSWSRCSESVAIPPTAPVPHRPRLRGMSTS